MHVFYDEKAMFYHCLGLFMMHQFFYATSANNEASLHGNALESKYLSVVQFKVF